jgi:hypothetical protein
VYKPPKKVPGTDPTNTSTTGLPSAPDTTGTALPRLTPDTAPITVRPDRPGGYLPDSESTVEPVHGGATRETRPVHPGEVVVIDLASPEPPNPSLPPDLLVVGPESVRDLVSLEDSGLLMDSSDTFYANVEGVGVTGVQTDVNGQFVLRSQSPHQDRLVLTRVEGKSQWRIRPDAKPPTDTGWNVPASPPNPISLKKLEINVWQASFLTQPDASGTSWSVRGSASRKYVQIKDGGVVMVTFHNNGDVQAVSATHPNANGPLLERIEGTSLWREKLQPVPAVKRPASSSTTGPSKRVRLDQPDRSATASVQSANRPPVNPDLWRTWGEREPVLSGSVKIGNLHYRTLPGSSTDVALIRPFTLAQGFDAFEGMLIAQPWRQPVRAVSQATVPAWNSSALPGTQWNVSGPLFDKPLTQTIAETFESFSQVTARTLARSLYEKALPSNAMTSQGLLHISDTLARWKGANHAEADATAAPLPRFTDPLQLLPEFHASEVSGWRTIALPLVDPAQTAHRVDFRLRQEDWQTLNQDPEPVGIRQLYKTLLTRSGYEVFLPSSQSKGATLVLKRAGQTYFMTLRNTASRLLHFDFPKDLYAPPLRTYLGDETYQVVISAHDRNSLNWLVGGLHLTETRQTDLFIYRVSAPEQRAARQPQTSGQEGQSLTDPYPSKSAPPTHASQASRNIPAEAVPPHDISVDGERHRLLPRATDDLIVYIDEPAHPARDFDTLETLLHTDRHNQPRGAIRVPPENAWMIDPFMAFEKSMAAYVADQFPVFSSVTLHNVARKLFILANGSTTTTGAGLTSLRQTFNDWRVGNTASRAEMADPLLMLPTVAITPSSSLTERKLVVPQKVNGELTRIDLEVNYFRAEYDYYLAHPGGLNFKIYMAQMLRHAGYSVLTPTGGGAWPALVFTRMGHDRVFFLSLYRIRDNFISLPDTPDPRTASTLIDRIGEPASEVLLAADAGGKVIWLKGGIQQMADLNTAFIVRDDIPMI